MVSIVENTEADLKIIGVYDTRVLRGILEGKWSKLWACGNSYKNWAWWVRTDIKMNTHRALSKQLSRCEKESGVHVVTARARKLPCS